MKKTGIYVIRHIVTGKLYVGSAKDIDNRWAVHRKQLREDRHHSPKLQNAWRKYGEDAFVFEVIETTAPDAMIEREQFYLDQTHSADRDGGYNVVRKAGSPLGFKHGPEMCAKVSAAHKGRKFTDEHRAKISAALKGRKPSDQTIAASVAYWTGKKHPPELIEKRVAKIRGKKLSGERLEKLQATLAKRRCLSLDAVQLIIDDRRRGLTIGQLAEKHNCSTHPIRRVLAGKYRLIVEA